MRNITFYLTVCCLFALGFVSGQTTVSKTYGGPTVSVDGCGSYCVALPGVTFTTADFPAGSIITDVNVSINWLKTDGSCAAPATGGSFHNETNFRINNPSSNVILATPNTWSGGVSSPTVTTVFDQSAATTPSGTPVNGTFLPNGGNLNNFNCQSPLGTWVLWAGDTAGADPLCVNSYTVTITAVMGDITAVCVPDFTLQLDASGQASITAADIDNGSSSGCSPFNLSIDKSTFDCSDIGPNTITLTITDSGGNTATCTTVVTVEDNIAPQAICSAAPPIQNVAIISNPGFGNPLATSLTNNGYTVTYNGTTPPSAAILATTDAVFLIRTTGNADLATWVQNGGVLITEWDANVWALNTANLINATDSGGGGVSSGTPVTFTGTSIGQTLETGLPNPYADGGATEFFRNFTALGASVEIHATRPGNIPVIIGDNAGLGYVLAISYDYQDIGGGLPGSNTEQLMLNILAANYNTPLVIQLDSDGIASITAADIDSGSTDNCGIVSSSVSPNTFDCSNIGPNIVTLTVTDASGNSSTCTRTIIIEDNIAPVITCVPNATRDTDPGVCEYTVVGTEFDATFTDNCTSAIITNDLNGTATLAGEVLPLGDTTVVWIVDDGNGQTATCTTVITIEDNEAPVLACVTDQTIDTDAGVCTYTHSGIAWDATATDNCSVDTITYELTGVTTGTGTSLDGVVFNLGETTVTWTATDGSTNTDVCSFTVTVEDNEAPEITCVTDQIIDTDAGVCTYTHSGIAWDATATDNCSVDTIAYELTGATTGTGTTLDGVVFNLGETTVTWTATDGSTNTDVCLFTVTVEDNEAPIAMCAAPFTIQLDANGDASITVADIDMGSTDNCGIDTITISQSDFDCSHVGDNTITLTITDVNGNISTCTTVVTVEDNVAPEAICAAPFTVQLDFFGNASITVADIDNGSSDACGIASMTIEPSEFTCDDIGDNVVTLTVTDNNGNVSTCTTVVTVEDTLAPQIVCPNDIVIDTEPGSCEATVFFAPASAFDNCEGFIATTQTAGPPSGSTFPIGVTTISFSATDASGNTATCDFTITVVDNQAPVAVCQNITIALDADGLASITAEDLDGGSTDNCGSALTFTASQTDFDCSHVGDNTITLTVTDAEGNSSTCTAIVTVEDTIAPEALCVAPFTIQLDANGTASITAADIDAGSSDTCGIDSITISQSEFTCADLGENVITLTVTDPSGNESTCTTTVTVEDTIDPIVACLDFTLELGADGTALLTPEDIGGTSTDNCEITITAIDIEEFDCDDIGTPVLVTYFASDASGNIASCTAMVTVIDALGPVIDCPADQTVDTDPDSITYTVPDYFGEGLATATDNCTDPVTIFTQDPAPGTLLLDGTYTVTLTAEDAFGNETVCEFELIVETILGAEDRTDFSSLTMYPNPAEYTVTIGNPNSLAIDKVAVYDLQGRLVMNINTQGATGNQTLDVSELSSAVYMVVIESEGRQSVKRLIRK
tara:strand:- start:201 stop:4634 length:4434 start_codon:yes stop_codon:yes gene_type:complete